VSDIEVREKNIGVVTLDVTLDFRYPKGDADKLAEERELLHNYLRHNQVPRAQAYMVRLGRVLFEKGNYYFCEDGFYDYLLSVVPRSEPFALAALGCVSDEIQYTNARGEERTLMCWSVPADAIGAA
jgi:hypothetical protein